MLLFRRSQKSKPCYLHRTTLQRNNKQEAADPEDQPKGPRLISPSDALDLLIFLFLQSPLTHTSSRAEPRLGCLITHTHHTRTDINKRVTVTLSCKFCLEGGTGGDRATKGSVCAGQVYCGDTYPAQHVNLAHAKREQIAQKCIIEQSKNNTLFHLCSAIHTHTQTGYQSVTHSK